MPSDKNNQSISFFKRAYPARTFSELKTVVTDGAIYMMDLRISVPPSLFFTMVFNEDTKRGTNLFSLSGVLGKGFNHLIFEPLDIRQCILVRL